MEGLPPLDLNLIEDKQPEDDIVFERAFEVKGGFIYPDWLPGDAQDANHWIHFNERYVVYCAYEEKFNGDLLTYEMESEDWVREALFTQAEYDQAARLDDFSPLAFLYYCPSASSRKVRHRFEGSVKVYEGLHERYAKQYLAMDRLFLPRLADKYVFGDAYIIPFHVAF